ncbi:hypothetical protein J2Y48_001337 [Mycoplana sp. BE70]|uniref:DUF1579 domain-containing protein n=1 Tax=Mycoplana sp. BE70 TaxID=2817775 RepID=UPI00285F5306|nr:DUF1579 domain-containing protein [Mycoplana sp. BE70]MDR6756047.1 hypothetical protein [Mycoplana sp. BE70]
MQNEVTTQHHWLQRLIGDWDVSADAIDGPPEKSTWTEHVRPLGGRWVLCEGRGLMPDGQEAETLMTLGYDPQRGHYTGTWIGSMMNYLWHYEGVLEPTGDLLTLHSEGPDFKNEGKKVPYQDIITFIDDRHRTLTALVRQNDGSWDKMMEMHYWRRG